MVNGTTGAMDAVLNLASKKLAGFLVGMGMVWQIEIDASTPETFYAGITKIAAITLMAICYGVLQWVIDRRAQVAEEAAGVLREVRESQPTPTL